MVADNLNEQEPGLFPIEEVLPKYGGRETDFSLEDRVTNLIEALNLYDEVADIEADIRKFNNPTWLKQQQESLGKNVTYKWRRQKHEKHQQLLDHAKQAFLKAYTVESLVANGVSEEEAAEELDRQYGIFEKAYRGTSKGRREKRLKARNEYRLHSANDALLTSNPEATAPPVEAATAKAIAQNAFIGTFEPELAETKDKLIGLRDDKRAGFLPATHTEKNQAFELLDYMDNPKYPGDVNRRLEEIFIHQQKDANDKNFKGRDIEDYALDAVRSVVNEWADHLQDAIYSHAELVKLQRLLDSGISPRINLVEATEPEGDLTYDYNALIRYVDVSRVRNGEALPYDPLRTKEDRTIVHDTKNKIVENQYTGVGTLSQIQEYVDEAAEKLSVKDARQLMKDALADQAARRLFWYQRLTGVNMGKFQVFAQKALEHVKGIPAA